MGAWTAFPVMELRASWKKPIHIIMLALFSLMSLGFVLGGVQISAGSSDTGGAKLAINAPANLMFAATLLFGMILPFFVAVICGMPILTDFDRRVNRLVFSTPISMTRYAFSRFLGSIAVLGLILLLWTLVQMGLYELWPIDLTETVRVAFNPVAYLWPLLLVTLPLVVFVGGISMWLGVRTRQPVLVFALPVIVLVSGLFFVWTFSPEWLPLWADRGMMLADPTGIRWLTRTYLEEDRGVAFYNSAWILPDFWFGTSRLTMVLLGLLAVWATGRRLARTESRDRRIGNAGVLLARAAEGADAIGGARAAVTARAGPTSATVSVPGILGSTWVILRLETRFLLRSPGVWLFGPLILLQIWAATSFRPGTLDTEVLVTTGNAAAGGFNTVTLLLCFLTLFYTVESLVREERCGLSGIFCAAAAPTGAMLAGKALANAALAMMIVFAASLGIALTLLVQGFQSGLWSPFRVSEVLLIFGLLLTPTLILWTSFIVFLYAALRNRFVVYGVALGIVIGSGFLTRFGYLNWMSAWHLWSVVRWSELDRLGFMWAPIMVNRAIAILAATFFISLALAIWPRRLPDLRAVIDRIGPRPILRGLRFPLVIAIPVIALAGFAGLKVRSGYQGKPSVDAAKAYWKRNARTWEDVPSAALDSVTAEVRLFPNRRALEVDATYTIRNPHESPMSEIPLTPGPHMTFTDWTVGGKPVDASAKNPSAPSIENRSGLYVVRPEKPLAKDDSVVVGFRSKGNLPAGWSRLSSGAEEFVLPSGVVLTTFSPSFLPVLGFMDGMGVDEKNRRDAREFPLDYWKTRVDPAFGPAWATNLRLTVEGPADWTLNSIGVVKESTEANGRRRTTWESDHPVRFFNIVGGPLAEAKGESTTVYHDPRTGANVATMVKALDAARAKYSEWFAPYPWKLLRVTEFPGLAGYAQGFPGNISFSEVIGFMTRPNSDDEDDVDSAFYIVAHEAGHQWWGNIVTPGKGPGGAVISEGLANFAAAMLMHAEKGEAQRRVLLRRWEKSYIEGRRADSERPINRIDGSRPGDTVVTYDRAGFVFWMLRELMGEDSMLAGMKEFVTKWKDGVPSTGGLDFPLVEDFVAALRPHAPDVEAFDAFVDQWIFGSVLPEFTIENLETLQQGEGWTVRGRIENIGTGDANITVRLQGEIPNPASAKDGSKLGPAHRDLTVRVVAGTPTEFTIVAPFKPVKVLVDPEVMVLQAGRKRSEKSLNGPS